MTIVDILAIIIPVAATLFILTLAYGDNPLYELGSYALVGSSAGWATVQIIGFLQKSAWTPTISGKPIYLLSIVLGAALFTRYIPKFGWIYRYAIAVVIGTGIGLAITGAIGAQITKQITANFLSLTNGVPLTILSNALIIVGSICSLSYFLFTEKLRNKYTMPVGKVGRYFLMATFGAEFGSAMTFRFNVLIGRINYLVLPENLYYSIAITVLVLVFLVGYNFLKKK